MFRRDKSSLRDSRNRGKTHGVIAGLVLAISIRMAQCQIIGMART
jgi:hypothetical protein